MDRHASLVPPRGTLRGTLGGTRRYPIGINCTGSDLTFGCCGCDNCRGSIVDVATRLDVRAHRRVSSGTSQQAARSAYPRGAAQLKLERLQVVQRSIGYAKPVWVVLQASE